MRPAIAMRADISDKRARLDVNLVRAEVDQHVERVRLRHRRRVEPAFARHEAEIESADARSCAVQHIETVPPVLDHARGESGLGEARENGHAVRPGESAGANDHHWLGHALRRLAQCLRERLRPRPR